MFGIVWSVLIIGFGVFLKLTRNPGFATSKKFYWMFIILGLLTLTAKITLLLTKNQ
ncbi:hypothetical protein AAH994_04430 [Weeksellaceae bacterium A-14]|uniref:hypothetical protein n=1 Tax=Daejeonia sp. YH14 TaxID=3439042 RepID=UPI0031E4AD95